MCWRLGDVVDEELRRLDEQRGLEEVDAGGRSSVGAQHRFGVLDTHDVQTAREVVEGRCPLGVVVGSVLVDQRPLDAVFRVVHRRESERDVLGEVVAGVARQRPVAGGACEPRA